MQGAFRAAYALEAFEAMEAGRGAPQGAPQAVPPVRAVPHLRGRHHEEMQYLDLIADIINHGVEQPDRTGRPLLIPLNQQMLLLHQLLALVLLMRCIAFLC